jgi:hypothetical protein
MCNGHYAENVTSYLPHVAAVEDGNSNMGCFDPYYADSYPFLSIQGYCGIITVT